MDLQELSELNPEAARNGDAKFYVGRATLALRYAVTSTSEVFVLAPYVVRRTHYGADGDHSRDVTVHGPGDVTLGGRLYPIRTKRWLVGGSLGVQVPTGPRAPITRAAFLTQAEALKLGVERPTLDGRFRLGSGVFSPVAGVRALVQLADRWFGFGSLSATLPLYPSSDGYQKSASGGAQLGVAYSLKSPRLLLSAAVIGSAAGRDFLDGDRVSGPGGTLPGSIDVPNTGRFEVALAPALTWWLTTQLSLTAQARVPVYSAISEGPSRSDLQVTEPVGVVFGVAYDFDLLSSPAAAGR